MERGPKDYSQVFYLFINFVHKHSLLFNLQKTWYANNLDNLHKSLIYTRACGTQKQNFEKLNFFKMVN